MQFKNSRTDRHTDTKTHRAYKGLQVSPFNLTVNVGNDKFSTAYTLAGKNMIVTAFRHLPHKYFLLMR